MKAPTKIAVGPTGIQRQMMRVQEDRRVAALARKHLAEVVADPSKLIPLAVVKADLAKKPRSKTVLKSRAKHPEKFREYQRNYMRKRRAKTAHQRTVSNGDGIKAEA